MKLIAAVAAALPDFAAGWRQRARRPGESVAAILVLTLGIATVTSLFALVNAVLLRPIAGVASLRDLVNVHVDRTEDGFGGASYPDYVDYRVSGAPVDLAAFHGRGFAVGIGADARLVGGLVVSGNYFRVLGVRARLGRVIDESDDRVADASPVVVVTDAFWKTHLQADPAAVGQSIRLNGHPFTIIGVTSPGFAGHFIGFPLDVYTPLSMTSRAAPDQSLQARNADWLELLGRLKDGASSARVTSVLAAEAARLDADHPRAGKRRHIRLSPTTGLDDSLRGPATTFLVLVQAVGVLAFFLACANVAGLSFASMMRRRREIAVRLALGAAPWQVGRQFLGEALVLAGIAGAIGLLAARHIAMSFVALQPRSPIPLRLDVRWDAPTIAVGILTTGFGVLVLGVVPALWARRLQAAPVVAADRVVDGARGRAQQLAIAGQVAVTLALLVTSGLFLKAIDRARGLDPGFSLAGASLLTVDLGIPGREEPRGRAFAAELLARLAQEPGITAAAIARTVPLSFGAPTGAIRADGPVTNDEVGPTADWNAVTPGYFAALRIPVRAGRSFTDTDDAQGQRVAIVNESLARRLWPQTVAIGRSLGLGPDVFTVVGVAADTASRRVGEPRRLQVYVPFAQRYGSRMAVVARAAPGRGSAVEARLRREVQALDPDLPILLAMPMEAYAERSLAPQRIAGAVAGVLALAGLLLAAVGLHALLSRLVAQQTRQIGVRMALGARSRTVAADVVAGGLRVALVGACVGAPVAAGLARLAGGFLAGVSPLDPAVYAIATALLLASVAIACAWPAHRAARVDPAVALREE